VRLLKRAIAHEIFTSLNPRAGRTRRRRSAAGAAGQEHHGPRGTFPDYDLAERYRTLLKAT
jgi:hypothetical protein